MKQIALFSLVASSLAACGGGGGGSEAPAPVVPTNSAPQVNTFAAEVEGLSVTYTWEVSDANNDALSCTLNPGEGVDTVSIADCKATTSTVITFTEAGDYSANFTVSDTSQATAAQSLSVTLTPSNQKPEPSVVAGDNELVIFYNRSDDNYTGWGLHLWADDTCDAYDGPAIEWTAPVEKTGLDANYGAYWVVNLKPGFTDESCVNYIMHNGDNKAPNDFDQKASLANERMFWLLDGIDEIYTKATLFPKGVLIENTAAHWAALDTVFWNTQASAVSKVRLYSSAIDDMGYNGESGIEGDNFLEFMPVTNSATTLGLPRYSALEAFQASSADTSKAKQMLTGKLLAIAYDSDDTVLAATYVQTPQVLDALYTSGAADANEATLGLIYSDSEIIANLWAPTAQQVNLQIFNAAKELQNTQEMTVDSATGIWSLATPIASDRLYYRFELTVYHQEKNRFETIWSTDPYSVSLSTNGMYSQFVNLSDDDLKPSDWDSHIIPVIAEIEDAVIYEGSIRDFSIIDQSTTADNRGKYLAFTESSSVPVTHLKSLVDAGLTHFQILPANDMVSINEDFSGQINLNSTVGELCAFNANAPVCNVENDGATLLSVYESYDASSSDAQALADSMKGLDGYNFGYDPKHFNAPDGSFSSNAEGVARILEMRKMNQALHEMGLRTSLDVVYNHTNSAGLWDNSVLDKVVPGYYYRRDLTTGAVINETCCQDTETEHNMMDKLMLDSLVMWAKEYKFDAFRFDIMGSHSKSSIIAARDAVLAVDADSYFYGEGWGRNDEGYEQAAQYQMAGTEIGTFNDRPRDVIRAAALFKSSGSTADLDTIRLGLAGTLQSYQLQDRNGVIKSGKDFSQPSYAKDPADIINYVSKHDGETLWDKLQYSLATSMTSGDRVRAQNISIAMPLLSQGIPFLQIGGDLLRSKSMDRNSYDSGDWFNKVDFTKTSNNWNVGLPLAQDNEEAWSTILPIVENPETQVSSSQIAFASDVFNEFLSIRASSKLFRLSTTQDVKDRVGFHNTGTSQQSGLIVMSIDDGKGLSDLDTNNDALVVVINGTDMEQSFTVPTATGFELHNVQANSQDEQVKLASFVAGVSDGTFTVPALTAAIFVKPQGASQGLGLSAGATRDALDVPPYGNNTVYLNGSMNNNGEGGFTEQDAFVYQGNDIYQLDFTLSAGVYTFKVTSADAATVNLGYDDVTIGAGSIAFSNDTGEVSFTADTDGNYQFTLDETGVTPTLTIKNVATSVDCNALVDSADAIPFDIQGSGELYVRGDHSGWGAEEDYKLHYKGNNVYQAVATFDGEMNFKIASDDASWVTQLWVVESGTNNIDTTALALGVSYDVAYEDAGTDNNKANLTAGTYSFLLTLNEDNPAKGFNVGSLIIQTCQP
jgi:pullulanase